MNQPGPSHKQAIVASHRRSGTHLTIDTLLRNFPCFAPAAGAGPLNVDTALGDNTAATLQQFSQQYAAASYVWKTHANGDFSAFFGPDHETHRFFHQLYDQHPVIYVHRDGRDVMVSLFNYRRRYDDDYASVSFSDFIRQPNDYDKGRSPEHQSRTEYWAWHVDSWSERDCSMISFDRVRNEWEQAVGQLATIIGQPANEPLVNPTMRSRGKLASLGQRVIRRFQKLLGAKRSTAVAFHKGTSGQWEEHFSPDDLAYFKQTAGDANARLGYEHT